jgi:hypothetical protein
MAKKKTTAKKADKPAAPARRQKWFDDTSHEPLIESYARQLDSFIDTMADGVVDEGEIKAQEKRLIHLMKEVEPLLNDDLHAKVTRLLCELTAYDIMQLLHSFQEARPKTKFRG